MLPGVLMEVIVKYCKACGELIQRDCPDCARMRNCTTCGNTGLVYYPCHHVNPIANDNGSRTIEFINTWMVRG